MPIPLPINQEALVDGQGRITGVWQNLLRLLAIRSIDADAPPIATIVGGIVTATGSFVRVATEAAASTDDLDTINGGRDGRVLVVMASDSGDDVVLKDGTGNLALNGDMTLDHEQDTITLIYYGSTWRELARSGNAS